MLEQQMQGFVAALDKIASVDDVVKLILQTETSEINPVFLGIIEATNSPFVKKLGPFRRAVRKHINHICKTIARLTPTAAAACRDLQAKLL